MSKSTFKILFYIRKNQVNKEGKSGIMIRLTVNGEIVQFSSKLDVVPEQWDVNTQRMAGNSLKARQLNSLLDDVRTTLKNHYHDIEVHEAYVTAEKVRNAFLGITSRQQTLLELFRSHNEDVKKLVGIRPIDQAQMLPPNILLTNIARTNQNAIFNVAFIFDLLFLI